MDIEKKDVLGSGWMLVAAACFTIMNVLIKEASAKFALGSGELVFWRMLFSTVALGAAAVLRRDTFRTPHWKNHLNRSMVGTGAMLLLFYAVTHLPLATGVTLSYTSSIFLAVFSFLILKERISVYTQAVLLLGFAGVVLLLNPSFRSGQETAALAGLAGGAMSGWAYLKVRELSLAGEPGWRIVFYLSATGVAMSSVWATLTGWHMLSWQSAVYLSGIGVSALVAQLSMTRAYKVGNKFTVASLSYMTVVFSALSAAFFLGEELFWQEILGMCIIILSGILSSISPIAFKQRLQALFLRK
ncbi:DMT family transporter [Neisseria polysaccharea]|uniref:DMT family transporter n=1 Tax=Neisseria polysaccharea TaxID=489 RepID=UPI00272A8CBD|nr:DMT family transporter [Neisseria polysaccharea]